MMGEGWEGGDARRRRSRVMRKNPVAGAHTRASTLRHNMTEAEKRVWQILRLNRMKGYKFRRQVPIGRYIADFVCHESRLIVEIDGGQHDRSSPREAERSRLLQNEGYRILRFWNNDVLASLDGTHETIADEPGRSTPTQTLPLEGRGPFSGLGAQPETFRPDEQPS